MKNKHQLFADMAELVSKRSTCCRLAVGAVLVKDNRVVSIGYNGTASGQRHCEDHFREIYRSQFFMKYMSMEDFMQSKEFYDLHGLWSNDNELHAEQNALLFAAKSGIGTDGAQLYVTLSPCVHCAKVIAAAGVKKVFYTELYDRSQEGVNFLKRIGVECYKVSDAIEEEEKKHQEQQH